MNAAMSTTADSRARALQSRLNFWVYYSSQILFFGAEFTKLHAEDNGSRVRPIKDVDAISPQAKQRARGERNIRHDDREAS